MMSRIVKTEAVALRVSPYSESSHVVTWLTPGHGLVSTVMKGACRPKSPFLGQYDIFYTCELLFYIREINSVHIARECAPLSARARLREDWRAAALASYCCDLAARTGTGTHKEAGIFSLLTSSLDFMESNGAKPQLMFWFELHLARELGLAPQFDRCSACHCNLSTHSGDAAPVFFAAARGGLLCASCSRTTPHGSIRMSPDAVATLKAWRSASSPRIAHHSRCHRSQLLAFHHLLGMFLQYHLDLMPASRAIAFDITMIPKEASQGGKA